MSPGSAHLLDGSCAVARIDLYRSDAVCHYISRVAPFQGVERGRLDTIIGCETHQVESFYSPAFQNLVQAQALRGFTLELGVGVLVRGKGLAHRRLDRFGVYARV